MRIAFISYEFPPDTGKGGIGTYIQQIARAMASMKWDVHVFCASDKRSVSFLQDGYRVHRILCNNGKEFRDKVVHTFEQQHATYPFDLMESPEINGNAWSIKKKFPEIPMVVRMHAPDYLVESLKKRYVPFLSKLRFVLGSIRRFKFDLGYWREYDKLNDPDYQFIQLANFIKAPSQSMKQWVVKNWKIEAQSINVIPNIFSPSEALLQIPVHDSCKFKRIVFFGRLNVLKGLVNSSKAMRKILKQYPEWNFTVIGDDGPGPNHKVGMKAWMQEELQDVMDRVTFVDGMNYEELPNAISDSEIVLLPSLFESFSYACAEAMAAGKAVVGSKNGGMADLIKDGENGILVDPDKEKEIYEAIKRLIENNTERYQYSLKARQRILHDYNVVETAKLYDRYYEKIAGN